MLNILLLNLFPNLTRMSSATRYCRYNRYFCDNCNRNDYGFEKIPRQISAIAQRHDVLIGISTSGTSRNIINGFSGQGSWYN